MAEKPKILTLFYQLPFEIWCTRNIHSWRHFLKRHPCKNRAHYTTRSTHKLAEIDLEGTLELQATTKSKGSVSPRDNTLHQMLSKYTRPTTKFQRSWGVPLYKTHSSGCRPHETAMDGTINDLKFNK